MEGLRTIKDLKRYLTQVSKELPDGVDTRVFMSTDEEGNSHFGVSSVNGLYNYKTKPATANWKVEQILIGLEGKEKENSKVGLFIYPDQSIGEY